jgi:hypothetical protein
MLYKPEDIAPEFGFKKKTIYNLKSAGVLKEGVHYFRLDYGTLNGKGEPLKGRPRYDLEAIRELFKKGSPPANPEELIRTVETTVIPLYPLQRRRALKKKYAPQG